MSERMVNPQGEITSGRRNIGTGLSKLILQHRTASRESLQKIKDERLKRREKGNTTRKDKAN